MKRRLLLIGLIPLVLLFGCFASNSSLTDLQVTACDSAHENGNCGRLGDVGLVSASQCCSSLGKCCSTLTGRVVSSLLSEVQIAACKAAAANDNCDKLSDLDLVTKDQCCSGIGDCCSSIPIDQFKHVVLDAIETYFSNNPSRPPLSANELKDLIVAFFSFTADTVELSATGQYSGERLADIFNKAKGNSPVSLCTDSDAGRNYYVRGLTTVRYPQTYGMGTQSYYDLCSSGVLMEYYCSGNGSLGQEVYSCAHGCEDGACSLTPSPCVPATCSSLGKQCGIWPDGCGGNVSCGQLCQGEWTAAVNSAIKANTKNYLGDWSAMNVPIARGSTTYILIEPKAVGVPISNGYMIVIEEVSHGLTITTGLRITVMELTANNDLVYAYPQPYVTGGMSQIIVKKFTADKYNAGGKFLVKIVEPNEGSTTVNFQWR